MHDEYRIDHVVNCYQYGDLFVQYLGGIKKIAEACCHYSLAKMLREVLSCPVLLLCSL